MRLPRAYLSPTRSVPRSAGLSSMARVWYCLVACSSSLGKRTGMDDVLSASRLDLAFQQPPQQSRQPGFAAGAPDFREELIRVNGDVRLRQTRAGRRCRSPHPKTTAFETICRIACSISVAASVVGQCSSQYGPDRWQKSRTSSRITRPSSHGEPPDANALERSLPPLPDGFLPSCSCWPGYAPGAAGKIVVVLGAIVFHVDQSKP